MAPAVISLTFRCRVDPSGQADASFFLESLRGTPTSARHTNRARTAGSGGSTTSPHDSSAREINTLSETRKATHTCLSAITRTCERVKPCGRHYPSPATWLDFHGETRVPIGRRKASAPPIWRILPRGRVNPCRSYSSTAEVVVQRGQSSPQPLAMILNHLRHVCRSV